MVEENKKKKSVVRGCIKTTTGPWVVFRNMKDGGLATTYRHPSHREREKNRERELQRRAIAKKIFAGLRNHGNYDIPKHASYNDLLIAVCMEAGWHVDDCGNISRKNKGNTSEKLKPPSPCHANSDSNVLGTVTPDEVEEDFEVVRSQFSTPSQRSPERESDLKINLSLTSTGSE